MPTVRHLPQVLSGALAVCALAIAPYGVAQEKLRIAGNFSTDHSSSIAIEEFKKEVAAVTGGKTVIETFPNMQLGGAQENVTQTRAGTIAMTWVGMAFLSRTVPELEAVSLPFLFPSREIAYKVMDGPIGDLLQQKLADKGFVALGFMELGSRQVTNSVRPLDDPHAEFIFHTSAEVRKMIESGDDRWRSLVPDIVLRQGPWKEMARPAM